MAASATKRWLATSLKAVVTVSLIWLVLRGVDLEEAARYLHALSFGSLALVLEHFRINPACNPSL